MPILSTKVKSKQIYECSTVCVVKMEDKSSVAMETERFRICNRNKFVLINFAHIIALTINIEDLTP